MFIVLTNLLFFVSLSIGQNVKVEGYIFEDNNRGFLNEVSVAIHDATTEMLVTESSTDLSGLFTAELPAGKDYILKISKDLFFPKEEMLSTKGKTAGETVYSKVKLERKPGYIFDVTLAESGAPTATVDAITGARIEVFNNTKMEEILVVESLEGINFDVTFERGNHYTVLIRKDGYFNKRLEAYVDVEGCILCFEGVGTVTPGVSDVMSEGFQMGSVLANIELEPATLNRTIEVENIYYDLDKYAIREDAAVELDKVVRLLKDNPSIILELGSHTDSRGGTRYNKQLSTNRAKAAVEYIINKGGITNKRISYKGYGESNLVNRCSDGVKCSEREHQKNRRTELKIVGFEAIDPLENRSLSDMIIEEKLLREVENSEQIQVMPGQVPDFKEKNKTKSNLPVPSPKTKPSSLPKTTTATPNTSTTSEVSKTTKETEEVMNQAANKTSTKTNTAANNAMSDTKTGIITSAQKKTSEGKMGETLVRGSQTNLPKTNLPSGASANPSNMFNFGDDKILLVQNGQVEMVTKMIGNQLNKDITDMLMSNNIYMGSGASMSTFKFDSIDRMPVELLNAFLGKLAILKKADGFKLFQLSKDSMLPKEILDALN